MPVMTGGKIIEGSIGDIQQFAGTPSAGTDEVQTITFGGTPTGGTFTLTFQGVTTAAISWSATNARSCPISTQHSRRYPRLAQAASRQPSAP
jgi:hypothetical protein